MPTNANNPLIAVHPETKERLDKLGSKGDSYNDIIVRLLDGKKKPKDFFDGPDYGKIPEPVPEKGTIVPKTGTVKPTAAAVKSTVETFNPDKKICHGIPMRKVELGPGKPGYKCDECQTMMVIDGNP